MQFTGKNLRLVREGISLALAELHNQLATCPDVNLYERDLDDIEYQQADYEKLLAKIDLAVAKESR